MTSKLAIIASIVTGLAFVSAPDFAAADPKHCPPGLAKQDRCHGNFRANKHKNDRDYGHVRDYDRDRDRDRRRDFEDDLDDVYEEGFRAGLREGEYRIGQRLPRDRYDILPRDLYYDQYGRPLNDGYYYADVDGQRFLIEQATGAIVEMLLR